MIKHWVNARKPLIICITRLKKIVGVSRGSVMRKNWFTLPEPSTREASYREEGICFKADKKISMEDPNCHTASKISTHMAVFLLPDVYKRQNKLYAEMRYPYE